jgi:hypothetical protein
MAKGTEFEPSTGCQAPDFDTGNQKVGKPLSQVDIREL